MNVIILRSNPIAPDPRVEKEARSLAKSGYSVKAMGWDRTGLLPKLEKKDDYLIFRLTIRAKYGSGIMNLPALLRWQLGLMWWLIKNKNSYKIIHACDFDTILPALIMKIFFNKNVIYDIFDFYADHLRKTPKFLKNLIRKVDFWAIKKSDGVILVDDSRRLQIAGAKPKELIIIYNSPEDIYLETKKKQKIEKDYKLKIAYIGLLQVERGILDLIDVLKSHANWHLDLAGFGGDEELILKFIKNKENITWHGRIDYQSALCLSNEADVLFATYDPSIPNHRYSSPNKVFEAMMLGKPIIVAKDTNMDTIIKKVNCGIIINYGDKKELEDSLFLLENHLSIRTKLGKNARRAYEDIYSWEKMESRLKQFYNHLF